LRTVLYECVGGAERRKVMCIYVTAGCFRQLELCACSTLSCVSHWAQVPNLSPQPSRAVPPADVIDVACWCCWMFMLLSDAPRRKMISWCTSATVSNHGSWLSTCPTDIPSEEQQAKNDKRAQQEQQPRQPCLLRLLGGQLCDEHISTVVSAAARAAANRLVGALVVERA